MSRARLGLEDATTTITRSQGDGVHHPAGRLRDDLARLAAGGHDVFIEVGAHPSLARFIRESVARDQESPLIVSSLRGGDHGLESMRWSAAFLYAAGFEIDWSRVSPPGRFIRLPSYPWRRERYWLDDEEAAPRVVAPADAIPIVAADEHPDGLIDYLRDRTADILGLPPGQVDLDRPLLAMGLDSLTAMELKAEIDAHLGVKLPLSVLIEASSIRDVAGCAAECQRSAGTAAQGDPSPTPAVSAEARPSHGQKMLWYAHQFAPTGAAYHIAGAGRIPADLDRNALLRALPPRHRPARGAAEHVPGRR